MCNSIAARLDELAQIATATAELVRSSEDGTNKAALLFCRLAVAADEAVASLLRVTSAIEDTL
jgi:hypothetical protein